MSSAMWPIHRVAVVSGSSMSSCPRSISFALRVSFFLGGLPTWSPTQAGEIALLVTVVTVSSICGTLVFVMVVTVLATF